MQEKQRIPRPSIKIAHHRPRRQMASTMHTKIAQRSITRIRLHDSLKHPNIIALHNQVRHVLPRVESPAEPAFQVALQTSRVIRELVRHFRLVGCVDRTHVHGVIRERSAENAASACAWGRGDVLVGDVLGGAFRDVDAVTAHAVRRAGEQGGILRGHCVHGPQPLGLGTVVSAVGA